MNDRRKKRDSAQTGEVRTINGKIVLNATECAEVLGVSRPFMYQLLALEGFPSLRFGRKHVVPVEGLCRWLDEQTNEKFEFDL